MPSSGLNQKEIILNIKLLIIKNIFFLGITIFNKIDNIYCHKYCHKKIRKNNQLITTH